MRRVGSRAYPERAFKERAPISCRRAENPSARRSVAAGQRTRQRADQLSDVQVFVAESLERIGSVEETASDRLVDRGNARGMHDAQDDPEKGGVNADAQQNADHSPDDLHGLGLHLDLFQREFHEEKYDRKDQAEHQHQHDEQPDGEQRSHQFGTFARALHDGSERAGDPRARNDGSQHAGQYDVQSGERVVESAFLKSHKEVDQQDDQQKDADYGVDNPPHKIPSEKFKYYLLKLSFSDTISDSTTLPPADRRL